MALGKVLLADHVYEKRLADGDVEGIHDADEKSDEDELPFVNYVREGQCCQYKGENHGKRLSNDDAAMPVIAVAHVAAHPGQKEHGHLIGEAEDSEENGGTGQFIDEPLLRRGLHPRADQRNHLPGDEELKVPVLEGAEPRGQVENRVHPCPWMMARANSHDAVNARRLSTRG